MKSKLLLILVCAMILFTILFFALRKFISWVAGTDNEMKAKKRTSITRITTGYIQIMVLLLLCVILLCFAGSK